LLSHKAVIHVCSSKPTVLLRSPRPVTVEDHFGRRTMENNQTNEPTGSEKQQSATVASRNSGTQCKKIAIRKGIIFQLVFFIISIKIPRVLCTSAKFFAWLISSFLSLSLSLCLYREKYRYTYMKTMYCIYFYHFFYSRFYSFSSLYFFLSFSYMMSFNISDTDAFVSLL